MIQSSLPAHSQTQPQSQSSPFKIVIMGRPNTGKSTLFNRLIGKRRALVHDEPGVTRDRMEQKTEWLFRVNSKNEKIPVEIVDTGGLGGERFADEIQNQVQIAIEEADAVLFVFDSKDGLTPLDQELLVGLHRSGISKRNSHQVPVIGVVNKVDAEVHEDRISEFFTTGLDPILTVSAEHGRGMDDLKEAVLSLLMPSRLSNAGFTVSSTEPVDDHTLEGNELEDQGLEEENEGDDSKEPEKEIRTPRIAIVGRPNVGKSTLVNAILGQRRMITSPIAGTTVDSIDVLAPLNDKPFVWVDTAGIRRKAKTEQGIEVLSVVQTRKALEKADIAVLVLDGEAGITDQDEKIGGLIEEVGCSVVLAMNKWDVHKSNPKFTREMAAERIRKAMGFLKYAPILFISALEGKGFEDLGDLLEEIMHQRRLKVGTHEFTEWVREKSTIHNPENAKFYLCHQSGRYPPTFVCHVNDPDRVHFSLRRHLVNGLRERWGFMGSPIRMLFVEAKNKNRKAAPKAKAKKGGMRTMAKSSKVTRAIHAANSGRPSRAVKRLGRKKCEKR